uniref:Uncharacterized protein n=1 Tax=Arundo donax TaxID=35708 RepID=A0A0A9G7Y7_ARUDO
MPGLFFSLLRDFSILKY